MYVPCTRHTEGPNPIDVPKSYALPAPAQLESFPGGRYDVPPGNFGTYLPWFT
jgi:hypothetical protein